MILTYQPEGSTEPTVWTFDLGKFRTGDMESLEKRTGMDYATTFKQSLFTGNTRCRRALLWLLLRRDLHTIRYEDVDFADDELMIEMDTAEWAIARDAVAKDKTLSDEDRADALAAIDSASAEAPEPPGKSQPLSESDVSTA